MEGKISMTARRQVTNKLRDGYRKATKPDKTLILDKVMDTTGMGRSTARRLLTGPRLPDPARQIDRRALKARGYSDEARELLKHVWSLMGFPVREVPGRDARVVAPGAPAGRRPEQAVRHARGASRAADDERSHR